MTHAAIAQRMSEMSVARMKTLNTRQGYRSVNNRRLAAPISTATGYPRLGCVAVSARTRRIDGADQAIAIGADITGCCFHAGFSL
jgi:hypothetical protein